MASVCLLCNSQSYYPVVEGEDSFCCPGCRVVFQILKTKNLLENYRNTTLFQQALKSGLISNPALRQEVLTHQDQIIEKEKIFLEITDLWCPFCAELIKLVLVQEKGILNCSVDYSTDLLVVELAPRSISKPKIVSIIKSLGYTAIDLNTEERKKDNSLHLRFVIAAFCSLNAMMFSYPLYASYVDADHLSYGYLFAWISAISAFPVLTYSGFPIFKRFLSSMKIGIVNMETLVVLGVGAGLWLSFKTLISGGLQVYFDSLTVIITFMLLGKIIENRAKFSAKTALFQLVRGLPRKGRKRMEDGSFVFVDAKSIRTGDYIAVFAGEKCVLDGIVTEGLGFCDESILTGEAVPVQKEVGSLILGGSILQSGTILYQVTNAKEAPLLQQIVNLIRNDIGDKGFYIRAADYVARWFVPTVLALATITALTCLALNIKEPGQSSLQTAILRAMSVLLISCPCALGIAAPLAESQLIQNIAKLGAIVRNRGCLQFLGKESVVVFDKTGTITEGKFQVLSGLEQLNDNQKSLLKGLTAKSIHPIAMAIYNSIQCSEINIETVEEVIGHGIKGRVNGREICLGSLKFLSQLGIPNLQESHPVNSIKTTVYFAIDGICISTIALGDKIRKDVQETLKKLENVKTILLSGDSLPAVEAVAKACNFKEWYAGFTPLQKRDLIEKLKKEGSVICMIGDGINDAPALIAAHIGISAVNATQLSVQVSDILLTSEKLSIIPHIQNLSKKAHRIVNQNLFWAFFYNIVGLGLASFGALTPIFAAAAMIISSLIVLLNAKRLNSKIN